MVPHVARVTVIVTTMWGFLILMTFNELFCLIYILILIFSKSSLEVTKTTLNKAFLIVYEQLFCMKLYKYRIKYFNKILALYLILVFIFLVYLFIIIV